jgi:hypothetical protein
MVASFRALLSTQLRFRDLAPLAAIALAASFAQVSLHADRRIEMIVHVATFAAALLAVLHAIWIARAVGRSETVSLRPSPFL